MTERPFGWQKAKAEQAVKNPSHPIIWTVRQKPSAGAQERHICGCQDSQLSSANTP
jgi:hypothetical protein